MGWPEFEIKELTRYRFARASGYLSGLCVILSMMVFGMGIYVQIDVKNKIGLIEGMSEDVLPIFLFVVAFLGILTGISGSKICLANRSPSNRVFWAKYLFPFVMTEFILFLSIFVSSILCFVYIPILKKSFQKGITTAMRSYKNDKMKKIELDKLQIEYFCCGSESYKDWFPVDWVHEDYVSSSEKQAISKTNMEQGKHWIDDVPFSCCNPHSFRPCIHHHIHNNGFHYNYDFRTKMTIYSRGCVEVLMNYYGRELLTEVGVLMLSVSFVQLTVLILARLLQTSVKSSLESEDPDEPSLGYLIPYHRHEKALHQQDTIGKYPSPSKKPLLEDSGAGEEDEIDTDEILLYSSFETVSDADSQDNIEPVKTNAPFPHKYDANPPERNENSQYDTIHESEHVYANEITMPYHTTRQLGNKNDTQYDTIREPEHVYENELRLPNHTSRHVRYENDSQNDEVNEPGHVFENEITMPTHTPQFGNEKSAEYDTIPDPVHIYENGFAFPVHNARQLGNEKSAEYDTIPEPAHVYENGFPMPIHTSRPWGNGNDPQYDEVYKPKHTYYNELRVPNHTSRHVENENGSQHGAVLKPAHVFVNELRLPNHTSRPVKNESPTQYATVHTSRPVKNESPTQYATVHTSRPVKNESPTQYATVLKPAHVYVNELRLPKHTGRPVGNENTHCDVQTPADTSHLVGNENSSQYDAVLKRGYVRVNELRMQNQCKNSNKEYCVLKNINNIQACSKKHLKSMMYQSEFVNNKERFQ